MCVVCKDWESGKLTSKEAINNLGEMIIGTKNETKASHYYEAIEKILDKEVPFSETDEELDKSWHDEMHGDKE